jgi:predicted acetyltransferase
MKIAKAHKSEYEAILKFLEKAYGHTQAYFPLFYPTCWKKNNTDYKNILLIKEKGEICSLLRIFPLNTLQDSIKVKFAGIGSVATSYRHRGKGYMSDILFQSFKEMKRKNYPLSILWGDRQRYSNFGYEHAGRIIQLEINSRGLKNIKNDKIQVKRYLGEKEVLDKIIDAYNFHPYRKERSKKEFSLIYQNITSATYYTEKGRSFAYIVLRNNNVIEYGGKSDYILAILKYIITRFGSALTVDFPAEENIPDNIFSVASNWNIKPSGMVKIISLTDTVKLFSEKIKPLFPENQELTLTMTENRESVTIKKYNNEFEIKTGKGKNEVKLNEREMVQLLFGTFFRTPENTDEVTRKLLKKLFPFNLFLWYLDKI